MLTHLAPVVRPESVSPWVRLVVVVFLLRVRVVCPVGRTVVVVVTMLREWFKFRPTAAGQTVVLRTGT